MGRSLCIALIAMTACVGPRGLSGPVPPEPPRRTSLQMPISTLTLQNGLRVVVVEDAHSEEVQVTMRYAVGAADDPASQAGTAHLVEHLMFQQMLGDQSLFARLDAIATFFNAYTTADATVYVSRARPKRLDDLLTIETTRLGSRCASITDAAFTREREVVVQEYKLRDRYREVVAGAYAALYPDGHPYRRATELDRTSTITRAQACSFADKHYVPSNAVLVVSGPVRRAEVVAAVDALLGQLPAGTKPTPTPMPAPLPPKRTEVPGPLDEDSVLISWDLPNDPRQLAQAEALEPYLAGAIDAKIKGTVIPFSLGGERAPAFSLILVPGDDETIEQLIERAREAISNFPTALQATDIPALDALQFDTIQQNAIYSLLSSLDDAAARDMQLASFAYAGKDPNQSLAAMAAGLRELQPQTASQIAWRTLGFPRATVITLKARQGKKRGEKLPPASAPIHDIGQQRGAVDPEAAYKPASEELVPRVVAGMRTRDLPNGLRVVLLPVTSVPTVDIRLIFGAGSGDDGAKRGTALAAGKGLAWNMKHLRDALRFIAAGGTDLVDVGLDHTTFAARGVDMHIDVLLAGLRRWVRDGSYRFQNSSLQTALREQRKQVNEDTALADAARAALFGEAHPYTRAGLLRFASEQLTPTDAKQFRADYFTPDNATLVISGRFDAELADRWIDYLFGDWRGRAKPRPEPDAPVTTPVSLVHVEDLSQIKLDIAFPTTRDTRAQRLVAAAMLDEVVADVRHQLAASYVLHAGITERRLASEYTIEGWVDAARADEALKLIDQRLAALRSDATASARAFVTARKKVLTRLGSASRSSSSLGAQVEQEIRLGRAPMSDSQTALAVHKLTIDGMGAALQPLDLSRAVITMHGPAAETERALAVLGRKPTPVKIDLAALDAMEDAPLPGARAAAAPEPEPEPDDEGDEELAPAIIGQQPRPNVLLAFAAGYSSASVGDAVDREDTGTSGLTVTGMLAHRMTGSTMLGFQLGLGALTGNYKLDDYPLTTNGDHYTVSASAVFHGIVRNRLWGSILIGLHADRTNESVVVPTWRMGLAGGLEAGYDFVVRPDLHRFAVMARLESSLVSDAGFSGITLGLAYRRY